MKIDYSRGFRKQYKLLPPKLQAKIDKQIRLLNSNPSHASLHDHPLRGAFVGCRSISAGGDLRIIYRRHQDLMLVIAVGTHSQLYK